MDLLLWFIQNKSVFHIYWGWKLVGDGDPKYPQKLSHKIWATKISNDSTVLHIWTIVKQRKIHCCSNFADVIQIGENLREMKPSVLKELVTNA